MAKWWARWGPTVIWGASTTITIVVSVVSAYRALEERLDAMNSEIALRLQRIEIVLRIDPLTKDVPIRTVSDGQ